MKKQNSTKTSSSNTFTRCWFKKSSLFRSSRPEVFCWKGILRHFAKFTGKNLCQTLAEVNFTKFLRRPFLIEHLRWLLLFIDGAIPLRNFEFRKKNVPLLTKGFFSRSFNSCKFFHERFELRKEKELKGNSIELSTFLKYGLTEVEKAAM